VGAKPKPLKTTTLDPPDHPFVKSLRRQVGVLSDAAVHFTPEFLDRQTWRRTQYSDNAEWIRLLYFEPSQRVLERELLSLIGTHLTIAVLFDECVDGAFRVNEGWAKLHDEIAGRANALVDRFNKAKKRWKAEDGRPS